MEIGSKISAVEAGWRRIENGSVSTIGIVGYWTTTSSASMPLRSGTLWGLAGASALLNDQSYMAFRFTGDRLRVWLGCWATYTNDVLMVLDGKEYHLDCSIPSTGSTPQTYLSFEATDLDPNIVHRCKLRANDAYGDTAAQGRWTFDCIDIAEDAETLLTDGMETSGATAAGLMFFHGHNDHFKIVGTTATSNTSHCHVSKDDEYIEFYAYCSKMALASCLDKNYTTKAEFWVDGEFVDTFLCYHNTNSNVTRISKYWESKDDTPAIHHFKLVNKMANDSYKYLSVQGIYIDGYMCEMGGKYIDTGFAQTSNTAPWKVTSSTLYSGYSNWHIGNGYTPDNQWLSANGSKLNQWVQYDCLKPTLCSAFTISSRVAANVPYLPKTIILQGSDTGNDGAWHDIYSHTQETFAYNTSLDKPYYEQVFSAPRAYNFSKYRIFMNECLDATKPYIGVASWRIYVDPFLPRYLIKTKDGYFGFDKENHALVPSEPYELDNNIMQSKCLVAPEDLVAATDLLTDGFQIVSRYNRKVSISGPIGDAGMLVFATDTYVAGAERIRNMVLDSDMSGTSVGKFALSVDSGVTWYAHKNGKFAALSIDIADKPYAAMSATEQANFVAARDKILADGIVPADMVNIDWNALNMKKLRLAVALRRDVAEDNCSVSSLTWGYDAKSQLLSCDESVDRIILGDTFMLKARRDLDKMLVNVLTHGA